MANNKKYTGVAILILVAIIAIPVIIVMIVGTNKVPLWQQEIDKRLSTLTSEESLKGYVESQFASAIAPDADEVIAVKDGSTYTYKSRYEYIASKTGFTCEQTGAYNDDTRVSVSTFVNCHR